MQQPNNQPFDAYWQALTQGELNLPVLPELAFELHDLLSESNYDPATTCQALAQEPGLAAMLVKAANSVLNRGRVPISTLDMAVMRLGRTRTKALANAHLLKQLFHSDGPAKELLKAYWEQSLVYANRATYLADLSDETEPAEALLMALMQRVGGLPMISWLSLQPDTNQTNLASRFDSLSQHGIAATNHYLFEKWELGSDWEQVGQSYAEWHRNFEGELDCTDLCTLALWSTLEESSTPGPNLTEVPAYTKWVAAELPTAPGLGGLHDETAQARLNALAELLPQ